MTLCEATDIEALFSYEKFLDFYTVALSFLLDNYCPTVD